MATVLPSKNHSKIVDSLSEATTSASSISQFFCSFTTEYFNRNKHAFNSLEVMKTYFDNQQLADVTLITGTKRIHAHRLVLCASSDYFAEKFTSSLEEPIPNEIRINNIDEESLLDLVQYCYTGYIELRKDNLTLLFLGARLLKFETVVDACCQFLEDSLSPSNCLGGKKFADAQGYDRFSTIAKAYALKNFVEVIKNEEYLTLPAEEVAELLESEDLNVPSEEIIFHALMTWMKHDCENRFKDAGKLLSYIKLPLLSPELITTHILSNEMLMSQKTVHTLIAEVFRYHALPECRPVLQSGRALPRKSTIDALVSIGVAELGGSLYAIGGKDGSNTLDSVEKWDPAVGKWVYSTPLSGAQSDLGVAVLDNKLYAVGGFYDRNSLNTVEYYNSCTNKWTACAPMLKRRRGICSSIAVLDGYLYVLGGYGSSDCFDSVERYDPKTDTWSKVSPMSVARQHVGACTLNGRICAVGGIDDNNEVLTLVEVYDPGLNQWKQVSQLEEGRMGFCVAVKKSDLCNEIP